MRSNERVVGGFIRRLEEVAKQVVSVKLLSSGLEGYLDLQENVFKLQMDIQKSIGAVKLRPLKDQDIFNHLENLRHLRWQSRRLGDAIAWNVLLLNRQVLSALNKNDPTPVPSSWSDGHRGAFQFARLLTNRQLGIPIIHDITNVLRIGDVTFVNPGLPIGDSVYRTFELKTTRTGKSTNDSGETYVHLTVTAISNEPIPMIRPKSGAQAASTASPDLEAPPQHRRPDRRIERQMQRMDIATASKNAPMHQFAKVGDEHVFSIQLKTEPQPRWQELRRAIRAARQNGFAYFELGGFVGYSLIYNASGVTVDDVQVAPMADCVAGLIHKQISNRNSITVTELPARENDTFSSDVLPLFLWDVPQRAIQDILRRRLVIIATYNSGWMEKLLSDAGLIVNAADSPGPDGRDFEVVARMSWENGRGESHSRGPWKDISIAVHEFRGPDAVVQRGLLPTLLPQFATFEDMVAIRAHDSPATPPTSHMADPD